jgi:hypothetical protein
VISYRVWEDLYRGDPAIVGKPIRFAEVATSIAGVLQGRDFGPDDRTATTPVAIINKTFMKRYLSGRDPIGARFAAGYPAPDPRNEVTVIGVVDDVRQRT